jgi:hypothetical protein
VPLNTVPDTVPPHTTVNHDYAVPSDNFGGSCSYPASSALLPANTFGGHPTQYQPE